MSLPDGRAISSLKVTDLKKELEKRGLSKSGVKRELADRLEIFIREEEQQHASDSSVAENSADVENEAEKTEMTNVCDAEATKNEMVGESNDEDIEDPKANVTLQADASHEETRRETVSTELMEVQEEPVTHDVQSLQSEFKPSTETREEKPDDKRREVESNKSAVILAEMDSAETEDADHEILQGNVSDDEAITGRVSPEVQPGASALSVGGGAGDALKEEQTASAGNANQNEGDNDELEEGEMRDEEDEGDVSKLKTSCVQEEPRASSEKSLGASGNSGGSGSGGGTTTRKRQWGIRRPSVKTYVEVPLSSQALNTLVEVVPSASAAEDDEPERALQRKSEANEDEAEPTENDNRQVLVEEAMEEGEVPSTPASELISSVAAPQLAILAVADFDELAKEEPKEVPEVRVKMRPASPPATSPVTHDASPRKTSPTTKAKKKGLRETRAVGYHVEDPIRGRPAELPSHPASDTIHIRGLVRPFTLNQLKDLLSRFGNIQSFWIDRVKSKAYVRFDSTEEATNAREDLDGCKWPSINPRLLRVDFSSQEELEWMTEHGESGKPFPKATPSTAETASSRPIAGGKASGSTTAGVAEKSEPSEGRKGEEGSAGPLRERNRERGERRDEERGRERPSGAASPGESRKRARARSSRSPSGGRYRSADREKERETRRAGGESASGAPVREWDRDKIRQSDSPPTRRPRRRSRSPAVTREKPSKGVSAASPGHVGAKERSGVRKEEAGAAKATAATTPNPAPAKEEPGRLLDDLFRKTKVVPSVYWLPLTEEQIKAKQREREEREERIKVRQQHRESSGPERAPVPARGPTTSGHMKGPGPSAGGRHQAASSGRRRSRSRSRSRSRRREWDSRRR